MIGMPASGVDKGTRYRSPTPCKQIFFGTINLSDAAFRYNDRRVKDHARDHACLRAHEIAAVASSSFQNSLGANYFVTLEQ